MRVFGITIFPLSIAEATAIGGIFRGRPLKVSPYYTALAVPRVWQLTFKLFFVWGSEWESLCALVDHQIMGNGKLFRPAA
jgi:hypothetical protein